MNIDMNSDNFLALLECISEGITAGIRNYRAALKNGAVAAEPAEAAPAPEAAPAKKTKKEKKEKKRLTVAQMTVKILRASAVPLSKSDILEIATKKYGVDVNSMTLSMVLNRAVKAGKKIQRVRHGYYTLATRKSKAVAEETAPVEAPAEAPVEAPAEQE